MTWTKGNQLKQFHYTSFTYDGFGRRTSKTITSIKARYTVNYYYDSQGRLIKSSDGMEYFYDNSGVVAFKYEGEYYTYQKDIQNNVIGILDSEGNQVVKYEYDAWGNVVGGGFKKTFNQPTSIGDINPFRYRSYFYDTDTGLYYLQSRYYDPAICRFISPDSVDYANPNAINGLNLFAYCYNNPVRYLDPMGNIPIANFVSRITTSVKFEGLYSPWWGRLCYSASKSYQNEESGFFYAFSGIDTDLSVSGGVGINVWDWLGIELGYNENFNLTLSANITPWFHFGLELGLSGINGSVGINIGEISHDLSFGIGLGPLALVAGAVALVASGGALAEIVLDFFKKILGI